MADQLIFRCSCGEEYDITDLPEGETKRCRCGVASVVKLPKPPSREVVDERLLNELHHAYDPEGDPDDRGVRDGLAGMITKLGLRFEWEVVAEYGVRASGPEGRQFYGPYGTLDHAAEAEEDLYRHGATTLRIRRRIVGQTVEVNHSDG